MQGPKMIPSAITLLSMEPDFPLFSIPTNWLVDNSGIAHSESRHVQGSCQPREGTLKELLGNNLCKKKGCISLQKVSGERGAILGSYSQLIAQANELIVEYENLSISKPSQALTQLAVFRKKMESIEFLANLMNLEATLTKAFFDNFTQSLDMFHANALALSKSEKYRDKLKDLAVRELLVGSSSPYQPIRNLIRSSAKEGSMGRMVHFLPQKFQDATDVAQLREDLPILFPQELNQLEQLTFRIDGDFTIYDLISIWRREIEIKLDDLFPDLANYKKLLESYRGSALVHLRHNGEFFGNPSSEINLNEIKAAFALKNNKDLLLLPIVVALWLQEKYNVTYVVVNDLSAGKVEMLKTFLSDGGLYQDIGEAWKAVERLDTMVLLENLK